MVLLKKLVKSREKIIRLVNGIFIHNLPKFKSHKKFFTLPTGKQICLRNNNFHFLSFWIGAFPSATGASARDCGAGAGGAMPKRAGLPAVRFLRINFISLLSGFSSAILLNCSMAFVLSFSLSY